MGEVQKKGENIMTYLNDQYHDRGMKKWAGFFLSEHTAAQEKVQKGLAHTNSPKPQMSEQEIGEVLQIARIKISLLLSKSKQLIMKETIMTILSALSKGPIHWGFMWETKRCTMTKLEMSNW